MQIFLTANHSSNVYHICFIVYVCSSCRTKSPQVKAALLYIFCTCIKIISRYMYTHRKMCHLSMAAQFHVLYVIFFFFSGLNFLHPIVNILVIYVLLRVAGGSKFSVVISFIFNSVSILIYFHL